MEKGDLQTPPPGSVGLHISHGSHRLTAANSHLLGFLVWTFGSGSDESQGPLHEGTLLPPAWLEHRSQTHLPREGSGLSFHPSGRFPQRARANGQGESEWWVGLWSLWAAPSPFKQAPLIYAKHMQIIQKRDTTSVECQKRPLEMSQPMPPHFTGEDRGPRQEGTCSRSLGHLGSEEGS